VRCGICAEILKSRKLLHDMSMTLNFGCKVAVVFTAMGITTATPTLSQEVQPIPTEFHGIWGWGAEECAVKNWRNQDTLHQIRGSDIEYWESECRVATLSRSVDDVDTLSLHLNCSGEGEAWQMDELWKKFEVGGAQYLIKVTLGRNEVRLYRSCS
jgi:hypothetical protein